MIKKQEALIDNALLFYKRGDFSLGYRTLLDAALNTNSSTVFKKTLDFVSCYEKELNEDKSSLFPMFETCSKEIRNVAIENKNLLGKTILKGEQLSKRYNKGRFVLGPIDIVLKMGDVFGLVGENGNGKTTLLTLLGSLIKATSGDLEYSFSTDATDQYDLMSKLVYIPQRTAVWYGPVIDNLKFTLVHHHVKGEKNELFVLMMIARFGLWKFKDLKWNELSSGYKMRFELARTMLRRPQIVLLDEPLANLDILAQQVILEDLRMMAKSHVNPIAMVFSSQQLYEVEKISDHVIYLRNGKLSNNNKVEKNKENQLVVELDSANSRDEIEQALTNENLVKIEYNGGVYILYFKENITFNDLLSLISTHNLKVQYIRDISNSTRRFFVY